MSKGQLSVDFYIALLGFLGFLAYTTFQLFQIVPVSTNNLKEESMRIEAYQVSELLVNDGGHPNDWYDETKYSLADIKRIGLSDSVNNITNYLSRAKVDELKKICVTNGNYQAVKDKLDIQDEFSITFIEHTLPSDTTWSCGPSVLSTKRFSFNMARTVSIGGVSFGDIVVEVWRI